MAEQIVIVSKNIILVFLGTFILLGLIGNIFTFLVFSSSSIRKHSISNYFRAIAICDLMILCNGIFHFLYNLIEFNLDVVNDFFCRIKSFIFYSFGAISPWLMVIVSVDRLLNIRYPKRFMFLHNTRYQIGLILAVSIYNFLLYSFMAWNVELKTTKSQNDTNISIVYECQFMNETEQVLGWIDFFNSTIVPFVFMFLLSISLIYLVRSSRSRVRDASKRSSGRSRRNNNRFAISVITLNLLFLILNLPIVVEDFIRDDSVVNQILNYIYELFYFMYYAIGFYAHLAVNIEFRHEFVRIFLARFFCLKLSSQSNPTTANSKANHLGQSSAHALN